MPDARSGSDLGWMLKRFIDEIPGALHAQTVSADGFHLTGSGGLSDDESQRFAAIASGLASLTDSAAETFGQSPVVRQMIETGDGWLLISRINRLASLTVVADKTVDLGLVGYEMTLLAERAGALLSPELVRELENTFLASHVS